MNLTPLMNVSDYGMTTEMFATNLIKGLKMVFIDLGVWKYLLVLLALRIVYQIVKVKTQKPKQKQNAKK